MNELYQQAIVRGPFCRLNIQNSTRPSVQARLPPRNPSVVDDEASPVFAAHTTGWQETGRRKPAKSSSWLTSLRYVVREYLTREQLSGFLWQFNPDNCCCNTKVNNFISNLMLAVLSAPGANTMKIQSFQVSSDVAGQSHERFQLPQNAPSLLSF